MVPFAGGAPAPARPQSSDSFDPRTLIQEPNQASTGPIKLVPLRARPEPLSFSSKASTIAATGYPRVLYDADDTAFLQQNIYTTPPTPKFPPRHHPFARNFEAPEWMNIIIHIILCGLAFPILFAFCAIGQGRSLFWARFAVGVGCGLVGVVLGLSLLRLGKSFLEAATWATLIHQSRHDDAPGIKLRDLAASSQDPTSAWAALRLLWSRLMYKGTARRSRKSYDSRPWSLFILFFLSLVIVAAALPFMLGRIVDIKTVMEHQRTRYREVSVKGDISDEDISKATSLQTVFNTFALTWTLSPFNARGDLPPAVSFRWQNDMVYFAEVAQSQLLPGGAGPGTFDVQTASASAVDLPESSSVTQIDPSRPVEPGVLLRFPRWGIRIHCEKIPSGDHIIPLSSAMFTYVFTPRSLLRSLFTSFGMEFPGIIDGPLNVTAAMQLNDTFPAALNAEDISNSSMGALWYHNGVSHSFKSMPMTMGAEGYGWVTIETVLVRLNTTYAPNGTFATYSDQAIPDINGKDTRIGYDAAVCLQLYEPYVVEVYNSTSGLPRSTKILSKSKSVVDVGIAPEQNTHQSLNDPSVIRELNSSKLSSVYDTLHGNGVNQLLKDNGRDSSYVSSPTLLSFTDGPKEPYGYTELSASSFAKARALGDASDALPYFAGSGNTLARAYPDSVISNVRIRTWEIIVLLVCVMLMGVVAGLFVPKLPFHLPKRGFELYSWLAAFQADEIVGLGKAEHAVIEKNMSLKDIDERMGDMRFRYGF